MSLVLSGKLVGIVTSNYTDRKTGEMSQNHAAEIFHKQAGKHEVDTVKIDKSTLAEWVKAEGKEVAVEVRPYAVMKTEGGVLQGFSLADKLALPTIMPAHK